MKQKLLLLICMLTLTLSASAAEEIKICGLSITDELAAQGNLVPALNAIEGVVATGSVTYNSATQTLVPDGAVEAYKAAKNWKNFQNIIEQSAYDAAAGIAASAVAAASAGHWYDMQGRCLPGKPTKSGIYVQRGRKLIVR